MLREEVLELLESAGEDLEIEVDADGDVHVCELDFEGFDEDYSEVMREYDHDRIDAIRSRLSSEAVEVEPDFYYWYQFEGFGVEWSYSSYDI